MSTPVNAATAEQARGLTDRIKVAVDGTWLLIQEAYTSRAWSALGYSSWDDYCTREFGTSRLRLPREERQEVVASLREIGMSVRAIAAATGDHYSTVSRELKSRVANATPDEDARDLALAEARMAADKGNRTSLDDLIRESGIDPSELDDDPDDEPAPAPHPVIGTDGKTYTATARKTPTQRPPLPPQFQTAANDLGRVIARIERLQGDDRYRQNRASIAALCLPEVRRAAVVLRDLVSDLGDE